MSRFSISTLLAVTFLIALWIAFGDQLYDQMLWIFCAIGAIAGRETVLPDGDRTFGNLLRSVWRHARSGGLLGFVLGPIVVAVASHRSQNFTLLELLELPAEHITYELVTILCVGSLSGGVFGSLGGAIVGPIRWVFFRSNRDNEPTESRVGHWRRKFVILLVLAAMAWIGVTTGQFVSSRYRVGRLDDRIIVGWRYTGPRWLRPLVEEAYTIPIFRRVAWISIRNELSVSMWESLEAFEDLELLDTSFDQTCTSAELAAACRAMQQMSPESVLLRISGPSLTPQHLSELRSLSVTSIDFSGSRLSGGDLLPLRQYQRVLWLVLDADQLTSDSIPYLSRLPTIGTLTLTLRGEGVGDQDLLRLKTLPQLTIHLDDTNVTKVGLQKSRTIFRSVYDFNE